MDHLPYSQACENNKGVILTHLRDVFAQTEQVLEIGSGTGQHATHFAANLPHIRWQPTEIMRNLPLLEPRCTAYAGDNLLPAQVLDVWDEPWEVSAMEAVFTANTLHIMPFTAVQRLFEVLGRQVLPGRLLCIYGPFNYGGNYTSESNARFDQWLAQQHPESAIRDFEAVDALAGASGFTLLSDNAMPANNRLLVWRQ